MLKTTYAVIWCRKFYRNIRNIVRYWNEQRLTLNVPYNPCRITGDSTLQQKCTKTGRIIPLRWNDSNQIMDKINRWKEYISELLNRKYQLENRSSVLSLNDLPTMEEVQIYTSKLNLRMQLQRCAFFWDYRIWWCAHYRRLAYFHIRCTGKREVARNWRNVLMILLFKGKVTDKD